jgi:hypothetical protein
MYNTNMERADLVHGETRRVRTDSMVASPTVMDKARTWKEVGGLSSTRKQYLMTCVKSQAVLWGWVICVKVFPYAEDKSGCDKSSGR